MMKERDFIKVINNYTNLIGDDCAYLKEIGLVITQDSFVEDVHFKTKWATPFQIGYKAAAVNISDILASGAKPEYITIGLSAPNIDEPFIKEFYRGIHAGSYGAKIAGGDLTGGDKIFISITAIGSTNGRKISSRKNAKSGYVVISRGKFGESSKGLEELIQGKTESTAIKAHLEPQLDVEFSEMISTQIQDDYAMMDTSDGLADALYQIAEQSHCTIEAVETDGMFGAEDYHLIAAVPEDFLPKIKNYDIIARVTPFNGTVLKIGNKEYSDYDELNLFNHWN